MSNRGSEVSMNPVNRKRGAKRITRENVSQSVEQAPNAPATQVDIARVCQVVA